MSKHLAKYLADCIYRDNPSGFIPTKVRKKMLRNPKDGTKHIVYAANAGQLHHKKPTLVVHVMTSANAEISHTETPYTSYALALADERKKIFHLRRRGYVTAR